MVFRVVRYSQPHTWSEVGQFYSVRQEFGGMRVLQLKELFPPIEAMASWEASDKTEAHWGVLKDASKNHLLGLTSELISVIRQMNEYQDNYPINFLVGDGKYEHSYEWCIEQWLVKGFRFQGQKYNIHHTIEYFVPRQIAPVGKPINMVFPLKLHGEPNFLPVSTCFDAMRGYGRCHTTRNFEPYIAYGIHEGAIALVTNGNQELAIKVGRQYQITNEMIDDSSYRKVWAGKEKHSEKELDSFRGKSAWGLDFEVLGDFLDGQIVPIVESIIVPPKEEVKPCQPVSIEVPVDKPKDHFVTTHNHTDKSDGLGKVEDLVQAAVDAGHPAVAITDHGTMMGAIEFYDLCNKFNIKPILGNECYLEHPYSSLLSQKPLAEGLQGDYKPGARFHQIVLAKNLVGYKNLSKLTTWSELENKKSSGKGKAYPLITLEKLEEFSEGLIVTSGCIGSLVPQLIIFGELDLALQTMKEYQQIFGEDYYVELQDHDSQPIYRTLNKQLLAFAKQLGLKWVISPDTHYMKECHYQTHRVFSCIKSDYNKTLRQAEESNFQYDKDLFFPTSDQLAERFSYLSVEDVEIGIASTLEIGEKVSTYDLFRPPTAPEFPLPAGVTAEEYLRQLSLEGLKNRFNSFAILAEYESKLPSKLKNVEIPQEYLDRLEYELGVIHDMGFDTYFLVVHDYIAWAKAQGIPTGMGRGSAAGCLVAYALKITGVDPIHHGLLFERFLNPERKSMPDIDSDFCQERRGEVIDYVIGKYGRDRVAQIGTVNTLTSKAVVKEVARVMQLPLSDADAVSKSIPVTRGKPTKLSVMISDKTPVAEFKERYETDFQFKTWIDFAIAIEGNMKSYGTHAAGVVIADIPIADLCPLMVNDKGIVCTQYTMDWIEKLGWLKMDFLGLKTLTVLNKAARDAEANKGITIDLERIPRGDSKVFDIFKRVDLEGVFQFESPLFQRLTQQLQPDNLEDVSTINAIARPGALDTGMTARVVEGKKDRSKIEYDHADLESLLNVTYGQAIYQEQILKIVQDIGGFSLGEADLVRRACGKKKSDVMKGYEDKFMAGCIAQGYPRELGEKLWEYILASAEYIFNKSHSMAYGYTAYDCAWFKTYHRSEFMAALMSYEGKREKVSRYLNASKRQGIAILPPDVNLSGVSFTPKDNQILFGLKPVKHLGEAAISSVITARQNHPFTDIVDFYTRTQVDTRGLATLIACGAFDSMHPNRKQLINSIESMKKWSDERKKAEKELPLIQQELEEAKDAGDAVVIKRKEKSLALRKSKLEKGYELPECIDCFTLEEQLFQERESIGFFVSGNPVESLPQKDLFPVLLEVDGADDEEEKEIDYKKWITASCAIVEKEHKIAKKNGNPYCEMLLEDHAGTAVRCMVFKNKLEVEGVVETIDNQLAFTGKFRVDLEDDSFKLTLQEIVS